MRTGMRRIALMAASLLTALFGCNKPDPKPIQPEQQAKVVEADGAGESAQHRVGPNPEGQPVEAAPPNVPEFKPAFAEQTRAKGVHTQSKFRVTEIAGPFSQPWAVAFLSDGRLLVTEKHKGKLLLVAKD